LQYLQLRSEYLTGVTPTLSPTLSEVTLYPI